MTQHAWNIISSMGAVTVVLTGWTSSDGHVTLVLAPKQLATVIIKSRRKRLARPILPV